MARRESPPRASGGRAGNGVTKKPRGPRMEAIVDGLDDLSKKDLVARAESLGIDGAAKFTKVELADEVRRAAGHDDRGFLGKARDLLKGVVEKGIAKALGGEARAPRETATTIARAAATTTHVPDDAPASISRPPASVAAPVATLTLAEIYLAQGHVARARSVARAMLESNPEDAAAKAFVARVTGAKATQPEPDAADLDDDHLYSVDAIDGDAFAPAVSEKAPAVPSMLDDAPFPARYDVDECVALAVDPTTLYVYWETRAATVARAHRALGGLAGTPGNGRPSDASSTLRVLSVEATPTGPRVTTRDFDVIDVELGEYFVRDLPAGAIVRAAIGLRRADRFLPMAHTLDVEAPPAVPSGQMARELVRWSEDSTGVLSADEVAAERYALPVLGPLARGPWSDDASDEPAQGDGAVDGLGLSSAELAARRQRARAPSDRLRGAPSSGSFRAS